MITTTNTITSRRTADEAFARSLRLKSLRSASRRSASDSLSPPCLPKRSVRSAPSRLELLPEQHSVRSNFSDENFVDEENKRAFDEEDDEAVDKGDDQAVDDEDDPLLYRALTGIEYTRTQHAEGRPAMQMTRFAFDTREQRHWRVLSVLRRAGRDRLATRVAMDDEREIWEVGVPRPDLVTEGAFGGVHDPQWWLGLDGAEIRTGSYADDADVKRARAALKGVETRWKNTIERSGGEKSKKQQETDWKLDEGLRRQQLGLKMNDSDDSDIDRGLFIPGGSDSSSSSSSSDTDSDDEPLILRLSRWRAEQQARYAAITDALRESSESSHSHADHRDRPRLHESDGSQSEPFVVEWRKWNAAQQESKDDAMPSEGEDDGPRIPVFSKWKAARQSNITDRLPNAPTKKQSDVSSSGEDEDVRPPKPTDEFEQTPTDNQRQ